MTNLLKKTEDNKLSRLAIIDDRFSFMYIEKHTDIYLVISIYSTYYTYKHTYILKFINAYKSASSRLIKKDFPEVRRKLWKEMFWSRSYCLLTTGGAPIETIRKYIENQGR